jgi:hypothetical protein
MTVKQDTRKLDQILAQFPARAEGILDATAFEVQANAQMNAPVDTGALKNSIHVEKPAQFVRRVSDGVEYGIHVEFPGVTRRWAGHPFMLPAVESARERWLKRWQELVK